MSGLSSENSSHYKSSLLHPSIIRWVLSPMILVPKFPRNMLKILMSDFQKQIRQKYFLNYFYHMTHVDNLPSILSAGEIKAKNRIKENEYKRLSNDDVQKRRAKRVVNSLPLHDYVPLYIGPKTPMVAVNQNQNEDFMFLRFSLDILKISGTVIADGNATTWSTKFVQFNEIDDLGCLDIDAIRGVKYSGDLELRRKKQAEILVPHGLSLSYILDIICYSESAKKRLLLIFKESGKLNPIIGVEKVWYFIPKTT